MRNQYCKFFSNSTRLRSNGSILAAAQVTLEALLHEPHDFIPFHIRRYTDHLPPEKYMSVEEISQILNTQPFIVTCLVRALRLSSDNTNGTDLNRTVVQKLIRVFNSTIDVRCLILFKMLDDNNDNYVDKMEVSRFYTSYLETIKYFEPHRIPAVVQVLLRIYQLNTVR